jgi:hypothetical protein
MAQESIRLPYGNKPEYRSKLREQCGAIGQIVGVMLSRLTGRRPKPAA